MVKSTRVAVAGAGFQGACVALELSRRGIKVDLIDREHLPVSRAGLGNEGKIHLGFVYAADSTHRTIDTMLRGALSFADALNRWIDFSADEPGLSTPFYYGVDTSSQLSLNAIIAHFGRVEKRYRQLRKSTKQAYLGEAESRIWTRIDSTRDMGGLDPDRFMGVFRTAERAVDPQRIARKLRERIASDSNINFLNNISVESASYQKGNGINLFLEHGGMKFSESYDQVVNALWDGRLALDATISGLPGRPWIFRNKLGLVVKQTCPDPHLPSLTIVLGKYGDIVNYQDGSYYFSWYPSSMIEKTSAISITDWKLSIDDARTCRIKQQTLDALSAYCPDIRQLAVMDQDGSIDTHLKGGAIFAWGNSDIDHSDSELHTRYEIGIESNHGYHSVNTGKYTMAPLYAIELAERITG